MASSGLAPDPAAEGCDDLLDDEWLLPPGERSEERGERRGEREPVENGEKSRTPSSQQTNFARAQTTDAPPPKPIPMPMFMPLKPMPFIGTPKPMRPPGERSACACCC